MPPCAFVERACHEHAKSVRRGRELGVHARLPRECDIGSDRAQVQQTLGMTGAPAVTLAFFAREARSQQARANSTSCVKMIPRFLTNEICELCPKWS